MKIPTYQDRKLIEMEIDPSFCANYVNIEKLKKDGWRYDRRDGCWKKEAKP